MKKLYESPKADCYVLNNTSFLSTSGETSGDAATNDIFESEYGASF